MFSRSIPLSYLTAVMVCFLPPNLYAANAKQDRLDWMERCSPSFESLSKNIHAKEIQERYNQRLLLLKERLADPKKAELLEEATKSLELLRNKGVHDPSDPLDIFDGLYPMVTKFEEPIAHVYFQKFLKSARLKELNDPDFLDRSGIELLTHLDIQKKLLSKEIANLLNAEINSPFFRPEYFGSALLRAISIAESPSAKELLEKYFKDSQLKNPLAWNGLNTSLKTILSRYSSWSRISEAHDRLVLNANQMLKPTDQFFFHHGGHLHLSTETNPIKIQFNLGSMKSDEGAAYGKRASKRSYAMIKYFKDLIFAANLAKQLNSNIQRIEFIAHNVVNVELVEMLESIGFRVQKNPNLQKYSSFEGFDVKGKFLRLTLDSTSAQTGDSFLKKSLNEILQHYNVNLDSLKAEIRLENNYQLLALEFYLSKKIKIDSKIVKKINEVDGYEKLKDLESPLD